MPHIHPLCCLAWTHHPMPALVCCRNRLRSNATLKKVPSWVSCVSHLDCSVSETMLLPVLIDAVLFNFFSPGEALRYAYSPNTAKNRELYGYRGAPLSRLGISYKRILGWSKAGCPPPVLQVPTLEDLSLVCSQGVAGNSWEGSPRRQKAAHCPRFQGSSPGEKSCSCATHQGRAADRAEESRGSTAAQEGPRQIATQGDLRAERSKARPRRATIARR